MPKTKKKARAVAPKVESQPLSVRIAVRVIEHARDVVAYVQAAKDEKTTRLFAQRSGSLRALVESSLEDRILAIEQFANAGKRVPRRRKSLPVGQPKAKE